jgi:hypothetical protein
MSQVLFEKGESSRPFEKDAAGQGILSDIGVLARGVLDQHESMNQEGVGLNWAVWTCVRAAHAFRRMRSKGADREAWLNIEGCGQLCGCSMTSNEGNLGFCFHLSTLHTL